MPNEHLRFYGQLRIGIKHIFRLLSLLIFMTVHQQQYAQSSTQPVYAAVNYFKIKPGKGETYTNLVKSTTHKILEYQFRQKSIMGWYFYEVLIPAGDEAKYNYVSVVISSNFSELMDNPVPPKDLYAKAVSGPMNYQQFMAQLLDCRTLEKREVYQYRAGINPNTPISKYVEIDYMKPYPGKTADYLKMETEVYYPIHQERIKLRALTNWGLYEKLLPYEMDSENDFITANFFDDLRSIIDPKYEAAFNSMPNNIDYIRLSGQVDQTRKMVRADLWKLVDHVDANNTK
ncbi:hypothetical protein [Flavihumibacter fluvii]|uniref:hypothetical protein n=1 Tax=Flavihumibacter fluvii TaxID=2838157 RepID=UPI001BDE2A90|nr:hypothetical protein [Flavihumibacter fluvii]ULQ53072.1 hypothetical protein KJS93_01920 [Flavihumibacter fluvii]